ncbi:MAG: hypothetical protein FJ076_09765 [Cyanobacteria bacterium K_DeepCast_35m_m1_288]|nr:hypothetical protein [Cyanobacteria bacterium K_DeepCast_35m_m1_288]MBM5797196.1 hypothetical protein [Cyanobacteria bacterium K_Offshore_0m_m2_072]
MKHVKIQTISLKNHPTLNERWVQDVIAEDPSILGIGDVVLKDKERIHRGAGRLDLLLQEADGHGRYEVELQLGSTDESHIIRTIEYWDIERKRYPQYDHTAVIVAEDITSRFLNVISLFNGHIPIMAIQFSAIEAGGGVGLHFTKVLDTVSRGFIDEDEEVAEPTDRGYWERRANKKTVAMCDTVLEACRSFLPQESQLSYNKHYMGFWVEGRACNFAILRPQKSVVRLDIKLPKTEENSGLIEAVELDCLDYDNRWSNYRIRIDANDLVSKQAAIIELLRNAYHLRQ